MTLYNSIDVYIYNCNLSHRKILRQVNGKKDSLILIRAKTFGWNIIKVQLLK